MNTLFEEETIRNALAGSRPDPGRFADEVRRKLSAAGDDVRPLADAATKPNGGSAWLLRAALSVVPAGALGLSKTASAAAKAMPLTLGQKAAGIALLPAAGLLVAGAAFVWGLRGLRDNPVDPGQEETSVDLSSWLRSHKWSTWFAYSLLLLVCLLGQSWVFFLTLTAGMLVVGHLSRRLGMKGVSLHGGALSPALAILAQLSVMLPRTGVGVLASPGAVALTLLGGALVTGLVATRARLAMWAAGTVIAVAAVAVSFADRLPIFKVGPEDVASWLTAPGAGANAAWDDVAAWAVDEHIRFGQSEVATEAVDAIADEDRNDDLARRQLAAAMRFGVISAAEVITRFAERRDTSVNDVEDWIASESPFGALPMELQEPRTLSRVEDNEWAVRTLAEADRLTPVDADWLAESLVRTLQKCIDDGFDATLVAANVVDVWDAIPGERPAPDDVVRSSILATYKRPGYVGEPAAGFARYAAMADRWWGAPDPAATLAGVVLMDRFGVPEEVDLRAVRLAAEPEWSSWAFGDDSRRVIRYVTARRVESLAEWRPRSALELGWDARNLLAAVMLSLLSIITVWRRGRPLQHDA